MKFYVKNNLNIVVNAHTAINAAIKIIRRIIRNKKSMNTFKYDLNEEITICNSENKEFHYIFIIKQNTDSKLKCKYYFFDYKIELFKKLAIK